MSETNQNERVVTRKGDWVTNGNYLLGVVKDVHDDGSLDIALYSHTGEFIGRDSPAEGGPTKFEPCCNPDGWRRIKKPTFPLARYYAIGALLETA